MKLRDIVLIDCEFRRDKLACFKEIIKLEVA